MSSKKKPSQVTLVNLHPPQDVSSKERPLPVTLRPSDSSNLVEVTQNAKITTSTRFNCVTYDTTDQEVIRTTGDKARLLLRDYTDGLEASWDFVPPLELVISLSLTLLTTSFRDSIGVSAEVWCALFYLIGAVSVVWLVIACVKRRRAPKIEDVVRALEGEQRDVG